MRMKHAAPRVLVLVALGLFAPDAGRAQALPAPGAPSERNLSGTRQTCSATNATRDQRCSVSCEPGQTADCEDGDASDLPTCRCGE